MAHEITIRQDGYAEMAFVGATPWHGLGQELEQGADLATWKRSAGMDWTLESAPVRYTDSTGNEQVYPDRKILHRSDTGAPMSVVSNRYKPVQPAEVLEFFNELVAESGFRLHTAGTLFGGKRMWALAETGKFAEISKGDGIGGFLLLSTSCDKSLSTTARFTSVRVVCNNTLGMATARGANSVSFTHARHFDHDLMRSKLGQAVESFGAFMDMGQALRKQKMSVESADKFVINLLADNAKILEDITAETKAIRESKGYAKIISLFDGGAKGADLAGHSKWGMLNAVTEYYDHHIPSRTNDARLNSTWFGGNNNIKNKAVALLVA